MYLGLWRYFSISTLDCELLIYGGPNADLNVPQDLGKYTDGNEIWKGLLWSLFQMCLGEGLLWRVCEDRCLYYCLLSNVSHHLMMLMKPKPTQAPWPSWYLSSWRQLTKPPYILQLNSQNLLWFINIEQLKSAAPKKQVNFVTFASTWENFYSKFK